MRKIILLGLLLCTIGVSRAQQPNSRPLTITLFNEGISFPYDQFITKPVHPGIMMETFHFFRNGKHSSLGWNVSLGYYFHKHLANGFFAQGNLVYQFQTGVGLYSQVQLGTGYLHVFRTGPEYVLKNGQYTKQADKGSGRLMPSLSFEVGWKLRPHDAQSPRIFTRYQTWIQYPFSPGFIPLLSHTNLHLGYTFYPF